MQQTIAVGRLYRFEVQGSRYDYESSFGIGYYEHTSYRFRWQGEGKLIRLSDGASWVFTFRTSGVTRFGGWSRFYGQSLERNLFIITGEEGRKPVDHASVIDLPQVVDMQAEAMLAQIEKATEIIPRIVVGVVEIGKLRKLGLLPMPDGQFALVVSD